MPAFFHRAQPLDFLRVQPRNACALFLFPLNDGVQIKAMYGLTIDFSDITDISLIEKSMRAIGVGTRTNGYGGFGETLKGHFKSIGLGETLLFVRSKSSPTIRIKRNGAKDVYISFRNGEDTERVYREMEEEYLFALNIS